MEQCKYNFRVSRLGILKIWYNYCEIELESKLKIVGFDQCTTTIEFLIEIEEIRQRNVEEKAG